MLTQIYHKYQTFCCTLGYLSSKSDVPLKPEEAVRSCGILLLRT